MTVGPTKTLIVEEPVVRLVVLRQPSDRIVIQQPPGLHVLRTTDRVVVAAPGPRGAPGPTGPPRPPDAREFTFTTAAETWVAEHDMGFTPAVGIYDPLGVQRSGVVVENNEVRTVVQFYFPAAGRLTLS